MTIRNREIKLQHGETTYSGQLTWDDATAGTRPGVLVCHTIRGRTDFEDAKTEALAALGYTALSVDLYGVASRGGDIDTLRELMNDLRADRPHLQRLVLDWLECLRKQAEVDAAKTAAIGFCFGGLCVLDIARTGADVAGVVSFHGIFVPPGNTTGKTIKSRVLALHGWDDPMATPDAVVALADELTEMGADWQIHGYGNTLHAFTNPAADDKDAGTVYNANANRRSWDAMQSFLAECFAN